MMQAQKDKQSAGGNGKGGQKKADGGVSISYFKVKQLKFYLKLGWVTI